MRSKFNKGVSMVEILISIAIFAILMVPIVSGIISSLNSSTEAKTLQYRNEFAENIMEYVKQDSIVNVMKGDYFGTVGSTGVATTASFFKDPTKADYDEHLKEMAAELLVDDPSFSINYDTSTVERENTATGEMTYYPYETYTITGSVNLGTKNEKYSYQMEISNKYYAEHESLDSAYVNPNNLALGIVEDIDHTKVALINGTIANYDTSVANAFLTKKIEKLKVSNPDWYEIYMQQQTDVDLFTADKGSRIITVKVSGSAQTGYKVACNLTYEDDNSMLKDANGNQMTIQYNPFEFNYPVDDEKGYATLPNIYLMYNVCLYNGKFVDDDYIAIDTSEVTDDTKINFFVVETAESYSDNVALSNDGLVQKDADGNITSRPTLYNKNVEAGADTRQDVKIHLVAQGGSDLKNLSVYHNFDKGGYNLNTPNAKNHDVLYSSSDMGIMDSFLTKVGRSYVPLVKYTFSGGATVKDVDNSVANIGSLNTAQEESRGLYDIKIWINKGDTVDTTVNPTLTGTKGGNES